MNLVHLGRRFRESLQSRSMEPKDEEWVRHHLTDLEFGLWNSMQTLDKCHSLGVARRLLERCPSAERELIAAALLHDVGKVRSSLGVAGRILATLLGAPSERFRDYHDHERIGAEMCRSRGIDLRICDLIQGRGPTEHVELLRRADDI